MFVSIKEAYDCLKDPTRRCNYDSQMNLKYSSKYDSNSNQRTYRAPRWDDYDRQNSHQSKDFHYYDPYYYRANKNRGYYSNFYSNMNENRYKSDPYTRSSQAKQTYQIHMRSQKSMDTSSPVIDLSVLHFDFHIGSFTC